MTRSLNTRGDFSSAIGLTPNTLPSTTERSRNRIATVAIAIILIVLVVVATMLVLVYHSWQADNTSGTTDRRTG